ncbi:CDP-alcohol phosphatidyltransferase family protein [Thalassospiraceae bacterium LMO-JJ14]|nr:CDP-alcohol phosphatidyltransferase family protein [Thalassospiraceae bacterium LMO-JJ14]
MHTTSESTDKAPLFPLIRHVSAWVSPVLIRSPFSANAVTTLSLIAGMWACWYLSQGTYADGVIAAILFFVCYILDNCDGEVARAKQQCSVFGDKYDTFVDWIVHTGFFIALGWGTARQSGQDIWLWLGLLGGLGGTINYAIGLYMDARDGATSAGAPVEPAESIGEAAMAPQTALQWLAFVLRELSRADFCIIVLVLALFDLTWVLLPTAALGAHAYWMMMFVQGARKQHV